MRNSQTEKKEMESIKTELEKLKLDNKHLTEKIQHVEE